MSWLGLALWNSSQLLRIIIRLLESVLLRLLERILLRLLEEMLLQSS